MPRARHLRRALFPSAGRRSATRPRSGTAGSPPAPGGSSSSGARSEFQRLVELEDGAVRIDGGGLVALPGFVDAHTHLPFGGDRSSEFSLRLKGWTYQQLAAQGMGIKTTVRATRAASADDLTAACLERLDRMLLHGTTTAEAKSGYGLNLDDELKQLAVIAAAGRRHPIDLIPTFMGAHEVPEEYPFEQGGLY